MKEVIKISPDFTFRGKKHTKETKETIRKKMKGRKITWGDKISKATQGRIPWNKGIPWPKNIRRKIKKVHQ